MATLPKLIKKDTKSEIAAIIAQHNAESVESVNSLAPVPQQPRTQTTLSVTMAALRQEPLALPFIALYDEHGLDYLPTLNAAVNVLSDLVQRNKNALAEMLLDLLEDCCQDGTNQSLTTDHYTQCILSRAVIRFNQYQYKTANHLFYALVDLTGVSPRIFEHIATTHNALRECDQALNCFHISLQLRTVAWLLGTGKIPCSFALIPAHHPSISAKVLYNAPPSATTTQAPPSSSSSSSSSSAAATSTTNKGSAKGNSTATSAKNNTKGKQPATTTTTAATATAIASNNANNAVIPVGSDHIHTASAGSRLVISSAKTQLNHTPSMTTAQSLMQEQYRPQTPAAIREMKQTFVKHLSTLSAANRTLVISFTTFDEYNGIVYISIPSQQHVSKYIPPFDYNIFQTQHNIRLTLDPVGTPRRIDKNNHLLYGVGTSSPDARLMIGSTMIGLATSFKGLGLYDQSRACLLHALDCYILHIGSEKHPFIANTYSTLIEIDLKSGDLDHALYHATSCVRVNKLCNPTSIETANSLMSLAEVNSLMAKLYGWSDSDSAITYGKDKSVLAAMSHQNKLRGTTHNPELAHAYATACALAYEEALTLHSTFDPIDAGCILTCLSHLSQQKKVLLGRPWPVDPQAWAWPGPTGKYNNRSTPMAQLSLHAAFSPLTSVIKRTASTLVPADTPVKTEEIATIFRIGGECLLLARESMESLVLLIKSRNFFITAPSPSTDYSAVIYALDDLISLAHNIIRTG